jgi:tRNA(fMet)-specific endonuclease VapC
VTCYLLDTDTLSLFLQDDPTVVSAVIRHLSDPIALPVIVVKEIWDGWAAVISKARTPDQIGAAHDRLSATLNELRNWPVVSFSSTAVNRYAVLKKQKLNVGANDLKIAAIALETGAVIVTRNRKDFARIPGTIIEDWGV